MRHLMKQQAQAMSAGIAVMKSSQPTSRLKG
jgi:hypothetical protein